MLAVPWGLGLAGEARGQTAGPVLAAQGARCRFLAECSQFDAIGLHLGTSVAVRTDVRRSYVDAQGGLRLSLTAGEVAEVGAAFAGHLVAAEAGELRAVGSPISLFVRGRLLPLPWGPLAAAPLRLALGYQHELVTEPLGSGEAPGWSRGTLRLVAGQRLGRFELDGSVGLVLAQPEGERLRAVGYELAAGASLRLLGGGTSGPELNLTAEALARAAVGSALPSQQALLLGLLGRTASGYGGGLALGVTALEGQAGVLAMARLQISWGKAHHNPWAERKAAEPETTPAFIWMLLGAIDPVLGAQGCVWTDPKPQRPSRQWFCIGHPAPDDPGQIVLPSKQRIPVGTHLWEFGKSLWLNDGTKVVKIPLVARYRQKVWDYLAEHWPQGGAGADPAAQPLCEGKIGLLHGLDQGSALMVANDDGGGAALLGAELLRELQCNPDPSLREQALQTFNVLGLARGRGPLRARPPLSDRLNEGAEGAAAPRRTGGGAKEASVAEHTVPPRLGPAIVSDKVRKHILTGELTKEGEAKGWHYEPTGEAQKGTYVLEATRSPVDEHGVYAANVMIEGVKKRARSSFFPAHWTTQEVEQAIEEAYQNKNPSQRVPGRYQGRTNRGIVIEMHLLGNGSIQSAYPLYERTPSR
ncbi:MAG TPA: EndoU domain-containing protein [Pseudomonadota bacterium]|nr:EndoU domain-containing protein [Pseudomonadota bacterium]